MPSDVQAVLERIEITISFGLDINTPFECFGAHRYVDRLIFWLFAPLTLVIGLLSIGFVRRRLWPSLERLWALSKVCKLNFLVYSVVSAKAFEGALRQHSQCP